MSNTPSKSENSKGRYFSQEKIAEIRNALAIILGNTQLLQKQPELTQDQKEKLETIAAQTHRIAKILQERQPDNPGKRGIRKSSRSRSSPKSRNRGKNAYALVASLHNRK